MSLSQSIIRIIDNRESNELRKVFEQELKESKGVFIIVAFIIENGLKSIFSNTIRERIKNKKLKVRVLTSTYQTGNKPNVFQLLYDWSEKYKEKKLFQAKRGDDDNFHPKVYIFKTNNKEFRALVGSSNFTKRCFRKNVGFNLLLELEKRIENEFYKGVSIIGKSVNAISIKSKGTKGYKKFLKQNFISNNLKIDN